MLVYVRTDSARADEIERLRQFRDEEAAFVYRVDRKGRGAWLSMLWPRHENGTTADDVVLEVDVLDETFSALTHATDEPGRKVSLPAAMLSQCSPRRLSVEEAAELRQRFDPFRGRM